MKLKAQGFEARSAEAIARRYPQERIDRQLRWIDRRSIKSNRLGLLRAAIEQDWPEPGKRSPKLGRPNDSDEQRRSSGVSFQEALRARAKQLGSDHF
ncbi:MAG TPA: hypothetical protein VF624_04300 [Tepidisphaeraceae bacterium]|jgi:hypothetical protein